MLDAARDAVTFAQGRTCEDLARDRQFALALVKCVEIVGEDAGRPALDQDATVPPPRQPEPQSEKGASRP